MPVDVVIDDMNDFERYIAPDTPSEVRGAILAGAPKNATKTKSMQCIVSDGHGGTVSFLVDDIHLLTTLVVNEDKVNLTMHDAVRVANFWNNVVERMK